MLLTHLIAMKAVRLYLVFCRTENYYSLRKLAHTGVVEKKILSGLILLLIISSLSRKTNSKGYAFVKRLKCLYYSV